LFTALLRYALLWCKPEMTTDGWRVGQTAIMNLKGSGFCCWVST